jgi:transcriptional regulator with XRE-family HTH domain
MANKKQPNPIDIHVGSRVRLRRMMLSMSQEKLGEQLGITFQQIQKYEKGTNRIGASRLQHIARVLSVPVSFFFEDAPGGTGEVTGMAEAPQTQQIVEFLSSAEGIQLNKAFVRIIHQ